MYWMMLLIDIVPCSARARGEHWSTKTGQADKGPVCTQQHIDEISSVEGQRAIQSLCVHNNIDR